MRARARSRHARRRHRRRRRRRRHLATALTAAPAALFVMMSELRTTALRTTVSAMRLVLWQSAGSSRGKLVENGS